MLFAQPTATAASQRWMDNDHMNGSGWWMMGLGMILVLALVVVLVFILARNSGTHSARDHLDAQDALDHRFARGEIDEDEYVKRREILKR